MNDSPTLCYAVEFFADVMDQKSGKDYLSSDLELAAEIGQNLLDRNKELEVLLKASQQYLEEQGKENEFLSKQLQAMRDVNDGRIKAYEQLEASALELHQTNERLQSETTTMKKHWQLLSETIETLETKCEDYRKEIDELQSDRIRLQREMAENFEYEAADGRDRKWSCSEDDKWDNEDQREKEMRLLNEKMSNLKAQHDLERMHRQELECELSELIGENQQLEQQLRVFIQQAENWQQEIHLIKSIDKSSGSRGSNRDSAEIDMDDSVVLLKSRPSSIVFDQKPAEVPGSPKESLKKTAPSFLSELDNQYHELSRKYDALLEKCQSGMNRNHLSNVDTVQRAIQAPPDDEVEVQKVFEMDYVITQRRRAHSDTTSMATPYKTGDYKKILSAIYEKIAETKNFKPL